jgi:hypothetical protein
MRRRAERWLGRSLEPAKSSTAPHPTRPALLSLKPAAAAAASAASAVSDSLLEEAGYEPFEDASAEALAAAGPAPSDAALAKPKRGRAKGKGKGKGKSSAPKPKKSKTSSLPTAPLAALESALQHHHTHASASLASPSLMPLAGAAMPEHSLSAAAAGSGGAAGSALGAAHSLAELVYVLPSSLLFPVPVASLPHVTCIGVQ